MKRLIIFIVVFCTASTTMFAQLRKVNNEAFTRGEKLTYSVYYDAALTGEIKAGSATLEIMDENKIINDRSTFHIVAYGKTKGAFSLFFRVVDRYETYLDEEAIAPWLFIRRVDEGGYIINQDITFNQSKKAAYFKDNKKGRTSTVVTPEYVQDIISAFYYARTYEFSSASANTDFPVKFMLDDTVYSTKFIYLGKETVNTAIGKIRCLKFKPQVLTGSTFKDPYPMVIYVSDDKNRVPVLAESEVIVGKVKMELVNYSGLKNSFTAMVD
jgi:hypothetical protein